MCTNVFFWGVIFTTWQQIKKAGESNEGIFWDFKNKIFHMLTKKGLKLANLDNVFL